MQGIIVASDRKQEWLLPWWWKHYSLHNSYPVAFFDFGMSPHALKWCEARGTVYRLPDEVPLKNIPQETRDKWEKRFGEGIWFFRSAWFKKPLALQNGPFVVNCWLDLDCQVLGPLGPLFESLTPDCEVAMVPELDVTHQIDLQQSHIFPDEVNYNSGVVLFRRGAKFLQDLGQMLAEENNRFVGDQNVLSRLIYLQNIPVKVLPRRFNWFKQLGPNPDALIVHYLSSWKLEIMKELNIHPTDTVSLREEI